MILSLSSEGRGPFSLQFPALSLLGEGGPLPALSSAGAGRVRAFPSMRLVPQLRSGQSFGNFNSNHQYSKLLTRRREPWFQGGKHCPEGNAYRLNFDEALPSRLQLDGCYDRCA
jgi:hypothetical protein